MRVALIRAAVGKGAAGNEPLSLVVKKKKMLVSRLPCPLRLKRERQLRGVGTDE